MSGTVELDTDGATLLIRFPYREDLLAEVRQLPRRRWDPKQKTWRVPAKDIDQVYAVFVRHLFDFAPTVMSLLAGTLGATAAPPKPAAIRDPPVAAPAAATDGAAPSPDRALSISALNQRVRDALRDRFREPFWIVGEVLDFEKQAGRQHRFFSLVEKAPGETRPRARVEAALFEREARELEQRFAKEDAGFALRDGIEIRALVRVDLYPQSGRFQVIVEDVDPSFTLGKLALTREQILRELRDQGLADRNRELPLPVPPLRIGVLTSPDSDGWNDFLRHLQEAKVGLEVALLPVRVQGVQLKASLLAGLTWFAARADEFDALCILRGGGSRTELAGFDDRELAFAVARHPLKVLVGIGHQRDQSVLDAIAHSEKTPTAVAEHLVRAIESARADVRGLAARLLGAVADRLGVQDRELDDAGHSLHRVVAGRLQQDRQFLATAGRDVAREALRRVAEATAELARAARDLHGSSLLRCERARHRLQRTAQLVEHAAERRLAGERSRLELLTQRRLLLDPARVLGRGYALLRGGDGRVVPAAARVRPNDPLVVQLRDGTVHGRADSIRLDPSP